MNPENTDNAWGGCMGVILVMLVLIVTIAFPSFYHDLWVAFARAVMTAGSTP